jgi:NAD(P)-dependent dehydrogenase (short-subunit alcohol dehydrogenase family)
MARRKRLDGKVVVITGAARGIGAATARALHARGASVVLVGLEPELLEQLATELGERASWYEADVTDMARLEDVARCVDVCFDGIDVLVANAGIHIIGALETAPVEQIERVLDVNLYGVWRTNRAFLPLLKKRGGYLLNIASQAAALHLPLMGPYAASKAAVEALSNCLRIEMAPSGVQIGCAYFSFIDTDLVRHSFEHPATQQGLPRYIKRVAPLPSAIRAIERAIDRRARTTWAPRGTGLSLRWRTFLQPLVERKLGRDRSLPETLRLARPDAREAPPQDPILGVAVPERDHVAP